jgi:hypothetical protein
MCSLQFGQSIKPEGTIHSGGCFPQALHMVGSAITEKAQ